MRGEGAKYHIPGRWLEYCGDAIAIGERKGQSSNVVHSVGQRISAQRGQRSGFSATSPALGCIDVLPQSHFP